MRVACPSAQCLLLSNAFLPFPLLPLTTFLQPSDLNPRQHHFPFRLDKTINIIQTTSFSFHSLSLSSTTFFTRFLASPPSHLVVSSSLVCRFPVSAPSGLRTSRPRYHLARQPVWRRQFDLLLPSSSSTYGISLCLFSDLRQAQRPPSHRTVRHCESLTVHCCIEAATH